MGRIKTQITKSLTRKFIEKHDDFEPNFEANKEKLKLVAKFESKKLRNTVAGYITRLVREKQKKE